MYCSAMIIENCISQPTGTYDLPLVVLVILGA